MGHLKAHKDQLQLNRSQKNLRRDAGHAIADFNMIEDGDLIMVCLSGGKDSYTLLEILRNLQKHAPIDFKLHVVNLDQKQPGFPSDVLPDYLSDLGADYKIIEKDTYSIVTDKISEDKTYCGLCSRLRRGILYNYAEEIGADKIALGHHRDDIIETLFLNMFFGGKLKAMPPKLLSDDKRNVIIRPLAYCKEKEIIKFSNLMNFPIIPCNLCGSQTNLQRQAIKEMLKDWDHKFPGRIETIFRSISNVSLSQLADINLFPFGDLKKRLNDSGGINVVDLH
jgi:tRNA 2-thiocytidine biosynthesis protein TtcA